jgi:hypothetical protein
MACTIDLANLTSQLRRQDTHTHTRTLENRHAEQLGQTVWTAPDSAPHRTPTPCKPRSPASNKRSPNYADCDDELDATRAANRQLITQLNVRNTSPGP